MGKDWKKKAAAKCKSDVNSRGGEMAGPKARTLERERCEGDGLDDEEGCGSSPEAKGRSGGRRRHTAGVDDSDSKRSGTKRRGTYLDEILSTRGKRKKFSF